MTREQAKAFVAAIVAMRENATDEQALTAPAIYATWKPGVAYTTKDRVLYDGTLYKVLQDHTSQDEWTPAAAASLFAKVLIPDAETIYAWEQPNSTNPYMKGDKVTHNGSTWQSTIDGNVWEPGVYGWEIVSVL